MKPPQRLLTIAVLPIKPFATAKQRLGGDVSAGTRREIAESMVTDVLMALRRAEAVDRVFVTSEPTANAIGTGYGAPWSWATRRAGHSAATMLGVARAVERGADRVLLVAADCPALDPLDVDDLLARQDPR